MADSCLTIAELSESHTSGHGLVVYCKNGHLGNTEALLWDRVIQVQATDWPVSPFRRTRPGIACYRLG